MTLPWCCLYTSTITTSDVVVALKTNVTGVRLKFGKFSTLRESLKGSVFSSFLRITSQADHLQLSMPSENEHLVSTKPLIDHCQDECNDAESLNVSCPSVNCLSWRSSQMTSCVSVRRYSRRQWLLNVSAWCKELSYEKVKPIIAHYCDVIIIRQWRRSCSKTWLTSGAGSWNLGLGNLGTFGIGQQCLQLTSPDVGTVIISTFHYFF